MTPGRMLARACDRSPAHGRQSVDAGRLGGEVLGEGAQAQRHAVDVRGRQPVGRVRGGGGVVRAVHGEHRAGGALRPPGGEPGGQVGGPAGDQGRVVHDAGRVAVPARQVLGADRGAVGGLPGERVGPHPVRHATEHAGVGEARTREDLRHLRDVAEHVGQVADRHGAAQLGAAGQPALQVADDVLPAAQELVQQDLPRAHGEAAGADQVDHLAPPLRADLQVVVDGGELPVECEPLPLVARHPVEHLVEQGHQPQAEPLERLVPLAVPVGVRNHDDLGRLCHQLAASPPIATPVSSP